MMRKRQLVCMAMVTVMMAMTGCSNDRNQSDVNQNQQTSAQSGTDEEADKNTGNESGNTKVTFTKFDKDATWDETAIAVDVSSGDVSIEEGGSYILSGTLSDGQVYVNVDSQEKVQLVLNGVNITCKDSAAIFIENADKVSITLAEGTENVLTDGGDAATTNADGCIYSKDDISINGTGSLVVNGTVSNGIDCNNDLKIVSGNITVNAVNNGIKAKQSISIKDGNIKVEAEDCVKASDKSDETEGTFYMEGGNMELKASDDGISATVSIDITGGKVTMDVVGKKTNCDGTESIADGCVVEK